MTLDETGNMGVTTIYEAGGSDWRLGMQLWLLGDNNNVGVANDMAVY